MGGGRRGGGVRRERGIGQRVTKRYYDAENFETTFKTTAKKSKSFDAATAKST